jgi:mRNA interferase YafQ
MAKRHRDMGAIRKVIDLLIVGEPLPARCREHLLSGDYAGYTECHVAGDLLMTYILSEEKVEFHRLGTHSDLF